MEKTILILKNSNNTESKKYFKENKLYYLNLKYLLRSHDCIKLLLEEIQQFGNINIESMHENIKSILTSLDKETQLFNQLKIVGSVAPINSTKNFDFETKLYNRLIAISKLQTCIPDYSTLNIGQIKTIQEEYNTFNKLTTDFLNEHSKECSCYIHAIEKTRDKLNDLIKSLTNKIEKNRLEKSKLEREIFTGKLFEKKKFTIEGENPFGNTNNVYEDSLKKVNVRNMSEHMTSIDEIYNVYINILNKIQGFHSVLNLEIKIYDTIGKTSKSISSSYNHFRFCIAQI